MKHGVGSSTSNSGWRRSACSTLYGFRFGAAGRGHVVRLPADVLVSSGGTVARRTLSLRYTYLVYDSDYRDYFLIDYSVSRIYKFFRRF
jgi:hypothetical protein